MKPMTNAAAWKGLEPTLGWIIRRRVKKHPEAEALVMVDGRRYTYAHLNDRLNRLSNAFSRFGVRKGDKVGLLLYNCNEFVEGVFASAKQGAVIVPLNFRLKQNELDYIINHSEVKALIYDAELDPVIAALRPNLSNVRQYIAVGKEVANSLNYEKVLEESDPAEPDAEVLETDIASLIYTAGTTGLPKGAMLSHRNHIWSCINSMLREGDHTKERNVIIPIPLFHIAGFQRFLITLFLGGKNVLMKSFDPIRFLATIQEEKTTATLMVPTQITMLTRVPDLNQYNRDSIVPFQFGAAPSGLKLLQEIKAIFPNADPQHCYGITETSATASYLPGSEFQKKMGSIGKKGHGYINIEVKVLNEQLEDVKPGEVGEIIIRGPNVMMGYYKNPEATSEAFYEGGWYKTGDMGIYDEEGYLFIVDRKKDMIISGGENIYCPEVESILTSHPKIAEASAIGYPDDLWGEVVRAIVVKKAGQDLTEQEVIEYCTTKMAKYKVPKSVVFLNALPVNAAGKVLKRVLREQYGKA
jgi:acyl-CoA synthetase (AMP-forming)/AMP-acid ligase II